MTIRDKGREAAFEPNPEVMKLWPDVSGNAINGSGEAETSPLVSAVRQELATMNSSLALTNIQTMDDVDKEAARLQKDLAELAAGSDFPK